MNDATRRMHPHEALGVAIEAERPGYSMPITDHDWEMWGSRVEMHLHSMRFRVVDSEAKAGRPMSAGELFDPSSDPDDTIVCHEGPCEFEAGRAVQDGLDPERWEPAVHAEFALAKSLADAGQDPESAAAVLAYLEDQRGVTIAVNAVERDRWLTLLRAAPPLHDPVGEAE